MIEHNKKEIKIRKEKLDLLRSQGFIFPNQFRRKNLILPIINKYKNIENFILSNKVHVSIAGRIISQRIMGKASFFNIQDSSGKIQIYIRKDDFLDTYKDLIELDLGDIIGIEGLLFKTRTNELTIHSHYIILLTKALRPLPSKFHGLKNQEIRYRKRYIDLIVNNEVKKIFFLRSKLIKSIRNFMDENDFLEVETPMMHPIPGGALARPFVTYHNALNNQMFLRISPELYLKRLIIGGFDRIYEINRNFRNEGLSIKHNPEFTMLEFYQSYSTYQDLIYFTEQLIFYLCDSIIGERKILYKDVLLDFTKPFKKLTVQEAIIYYNKNIKLEHINTVYNCKILLDSMDISYSNTDTIDMLQMIIFEKIVSNKIIQPTFITNYPIEYSPLSRKNDNNANIVDRFELFIAGYEIANGFSELNDPEEQLMRFKKQVNLKNSGNYEAMYCDHDYIEALEYGMPPVAGEGIGIDRLIMIFTNSLSIRDVILFPMLKKI